MLAEAERVEAIPNNAPTPVTLTWSVTIDRLFESLLRGGLALRDQALLMLLLHRVPVFRMSSTSRRHVILMARCARGFMEGTSGAHAHLARDCCILRQLDTVQAGESNSALFDSNRHMRSHGLASTNSSGGTRRI